MAAVTPQEKQYYDQLFDAASSEDTGVLAGKDALPLLTASSLPQQTLGEVWAIADPDNNGFLTRENWYRVGRLIGWLQHGDQTKVDQSLASKPGPFPTFKGYPPPPAAAVPSMTLSPQVTGSTAEGFSLPPLSPADRTQYTRIFVGCGPSNGLVGGDKARDVFLKSKLSYDKLGQIWNLADTQQRGSLDLPDFIVGMWLIRACMSNPSLSLPAALPSGIYEQASGGRPMPTKQTTFTSPIQRQVTGTLQPQVTGHSATGASGTPPLSSTMGSVRQASFPAPAGASGSAAWDISPEAKASSDKFFSQLDTQNKGVIEGDVAVPFMIQSQLDEASLASIWDLSDIRQEGKLDRDEFAVAMHLINQKLAGKELPAALPASLIPPNLRATHGPQPPAQPSAATRDLFDVFSDGPEITSPAVPIPAFLPQPPSRRGTAQESRRITEPQSVPQQPYTGGIAASGFANRSADLLGDDSQQAAAPSLPDSSADLGNKQNQLASINRSVADLEKEKAELQQSATSSAAQLEKLTSELEGARAKHETETKAVSDLRVRVAEQTAQLKKLQADVISEQSDLNAMRMEKDELEQALLHDKEEVRGLQARMKELADEKTGLLSLLERLKKDARQQKGLVSIAKKQVSTAEASRDGVQREIREAETAAEAGEAQQAQSPSLSAAAGVPLPHTPKALSPNATGTSQRSLNPFERLGRNSASRPNISTPGSHGSQSSATGVAALAGAGALAGVTVGALAANRHSIDENQELDSATPYETPRGELEHPNQQEEDPFGAPATGSFAAGQENSGFGDSFGNPSSAQGASQPQPDTDFDSAFADFDDGATVNQTPVPQLDGHGVFDSSQPSAIANDSEHGSVNGLAQGGVPAGIPKPAVLDALRPEAERTASTQAIPPSSTPATPAADSSTFQSEERTPAAAAAALAPTDIPDAGESSDEEEGPEDLETPRHARASAWATGDTHTSTSAVHSPRGSIDDHTKSRRSAPPPPTTRGSGSVHSPQPAPDNNIDPFGTASTSTATQDQDGDPSSQTTHDVSSAPGAYPAFDPFGAPAAAAGAAAVTASQLPSLTNNDNFSPSAFPPTGAAHPPSSQAGPATMFDDEFTNTEGVSSSSTTAPNAVGEAPPADAEASTFDDQFGSNQDFGAAGPFGSAEHNSVAGQTSSAFDDEFGSQTLRSSTHPPATATQGPPAAPAGQSSSMFDDEFANFDDEFENSPSQPTGEANNPSLPSQAFSTAPQISPAQIIPQGSGVGADAWELGGSSGQGHPAPQAGGLSFEDAFGGDFESSAMPAQNGGAPTASGYDASSAGVANSARPALPQRPTLDEPQADDLEDVKKLCAMGFSRSLVVDALDANGYDFQKALNVLLVK